MVSKNLKEVNRFRIIIKESIKMNTTFYDWTPESMLEVKLSEPDNFLKIRETLSRIGIASRKTKTLWQSCNILHKKGHYYITHFKELFCLDGKPTNLSVEDIARRNTIAKLLHDWKLLEIVDKSILESVVDLSTIKIIPYSEKSEWILESKYTVGKQHKLETQ